MFCSVILNVDFVIMKYSETIRKLPHKISYHCSHDPPSSAQDDDCYTLLYTVVHSTVSCCHLPTKQLFQAKDGTNNLTIISLRPVLPTGCFIFTDLCDLHDVFQPGYRDETLSITDAQWRIPFCELVQRVDQPSIDMKSDCIDELFDEVEVLYFGQFCDGSLTDGRKLPNSRKFEYGLPLLG
jgi:hypothetical protein